MANDVSTKLQPFNRPHKPNATTAAFLYRMYELLRDAPVAMSSHAKKRTFESAADGAHSWAVVCISEKALEHLVKTRGTKTLRRAHAVSREHRFQQIFGPEAKAWKQKDLMAFFFEHDTCALVTDEENRRHTTDHWSTLHRVPEGILCKGSFSVYARQRIDLVWADDLWASIKANEKLNRRRAG